MEHTILLLDDDPAILGILSNLIRTNHLGRVVCRLDKGAGALEELRFYQPELALVDLLLPDMDGISVVRQAMREGLPTRFIMISQVNNRDMTGKAYDAGIEFFLNKPINVKEAVRVIQNVQHTTELEQSIDSIRAALQPMAAPPVPLEPSTSVSQGVDSLLNQILSDIGIVGMTGTRELKNVVVEIREFRISHPNLPYHLRDMYANVCQKLYGSEKLSVQQKSMEQRIRRAIQRSFSHMAQLGAENAYDLLFTEYAPLLFELSQVRQEIRHLEHPKEYGGKINAKKFFEGLLIQLEKMENKKS